MVSNELKDCLLELNLSQLKEGAVEVYIMKTQRIECLRGSYFDFQISENRNVKISINPNFILSVCEKANFLHAKFRVTQGMNT